MGGNDRRVQKHDRGRRSCLNTGKEKSQLLKCILWLLHECCDMHALVYTHTHTFFFLLIFFPDDFRLIPEPISADLLIYKMEHIIAFGWWNKIMLQNLSQTIGQRGVNLGQVWWCKPAIPGQTNNRQTTNVNLDSHSILCSSLVLRSTSSMNFSHWCFLCRFHFFVCFYQR